MHDLVVVNAADRLEVLASAADHGVLPAAGTRVSHDDAPPAQAA